MRASNTISFNFKGRTARPLELKFTARSIRLAERELGRSISEACITERPQFSELTSILSWAGLMGGSIRNITLEQVDNFVDGYISDCIDAEADPDKKLSARGDAMLEILHACGRGLVEAAILRFNVFDDDELEEWNRKQTEEIEKLRAEEENDGAEVVPQDPPTPTETS